MTDDPVRALRDAAVAITAEQLRRERHRIANAVRAGGDAWVWQNIARDIVDAVLPILANVPPRG